MGIEKQPNQPQPLTLTTEAKDRIGSYYLPGLLKNLKHQDYDTAPFEYIPWDFLFNDKKVRIPESLSEKLDLKSLRWIAYYDMLPILLCGKELNSGYFKTDRFEDSLATIEIARRVENVKPTQELEHEDKIPFYLRIAGIDKKEGRIIAVKYDLTDDNRLTELNVLISQKEYMQYTKSVNRLDAGAAPIPTNVDKSYGTAGLITETMCSEANPLLALYTFNGKSIFPKAVVLSFKFEKNRYVLGKLGYYEERKNGTVTVGLRDDAAKDKDLTPWKISVPQFLQKV